MGIDTDARLVFGICMDEEDMNKVYRFFDMDTYIDDEDFVSAFCDRFPNLYVGYACPWYDADCPKWAYYIGIGAEDTQGAVPSPLKPLHARAQSTGPYTIADLKELLETWEKSGYRECLEAVGIAFAEPEVIALPHVY